MQITAPDMMPNGAEGMGITKMAISKGESIKNPLCLGSSLFAIEKSTKVSIVRI